MFTSKEHEKFQKYLEKTSLNDLYTPDLPKIQFPKWLPLKIQNVVKRQLDFISMQRDNPARMYVDMYPAFVGYFNRIKPVFVNKRMSPIWKKLFQDSAEITLKFSCYLFRMENIFDGGIRLLEKHKLELISYKRVIAKAKNLYEAMEEYQSHYYGHMLQENHDDIFNALSDFILNSTKSYEEMRQEWKNGSYLFCEYWPITRKSKAENALPIFFIKKIYSFFQNEDCKLTPTEVAEIANTIFDSAYTENEVIKHITFLKNVNEDSLD